jgi:hypothetical protein
MTNTTDTYWDVDGVSLHTFAQNIETLEGQTPPPLRGDDITVPYRPGQLWVPKTPDARVLSLGMWVRGANSDGSMPTSQSKRYQFFDNWRALRNLLWRPGEQLTLTKRMPISGTVKSMVAMAQFNGGLEPTMSGRWAAKFSVDLKLTDPYFYDPNWTTFNLTNGDNSIVLPGDVRTARIKAIINGARTNTIIKNTNDNVLVRYIDALASGDVATIDIQNFSSSTDPSGSPSAYSSNASVAHTGSPQWLLLKPGTTNINLASTSGTGAVQLLAKGAWI